MVAPAMGASTPPWAQGPKGPRTWTTPRMVRRAGELAGSVRAGVTATAELRLLR